jgi:hypothetical protein
MTQRRRRCATTMDEAEPMNKSSWTFDARRRIATAPDGTEIAYVSRPDVKFIHDELVGRDCYGGVDDAASSCAGLSLGDRVIDVGANIGLSSTMFSGRVGETGVVVGLEPIEETFGVFVRNATHLCGESMESTSTSVELDSEAPLSVGMKPVAGGPGTGKGKIYAHNVGVGSRSGESIEFTHFPRAAGWSTTSATRDDAETMENVVEYVYDALRPRNQDENDEHDGLESNVVTSVGRVIRGLILDESSSSSSSSAVSAAASPPTAPIWRRIISFVADCILRTLIRAVAAYMLAGARTSTRPIVTVSDVIDAHDAELDAVHLLKIDVERAEADVLRGIRPSHWPRIHRVVLECHDIDGALDDCVRILRSVGAFDVVSTHRLFGKTRLFNVYASRAPIH